MKRKCEIKAVDFDQMIPSIMAGKLDLAVAGMAATEDRKTAGFLYRALLSFTQYFYYQTKS